MTLGTVFTTYPPLYRPMLDAVADMDADVILALGTGTDPEALGVAETLPFLEADADGLRERSVRVLEQDAYRAAAQRIQDEILTLQAAPHLSSGSSRPAARRA